MKRKTRTDTPFQRPDGIFILYSGGRISKLEEWGTPISNEVELCLKEEEEQELIAFYDLADYLKKKLYLLCK